MPTSTSPTCSCSAGKPRRGPRKSASRPSTIHPMAGSIYLKTRRDQRQAEEPSISPSRISPPPQPCRAVHAIRPRCCLAIYLASRAAKRSVGQKAPGRGRAPSPPQQSHAPRLVLGQLAIRPATNSKARPPGPLAARRRPSPSLRNWPESHPPSLPWSLLPHPTFSPGPAERATSTSPADAIAELLNVRSEQSPSCRRSPPQFASDSRHHDKLVTSGKKENVGTACCVPVSNVFFSFASPR